jgi:phage virion morphogenesis protein
MIEITQDTISPWLTKAIDKVEKPQRLMDAIGAALVASSKLRFADGRGPDGSPWAPVLRGGRPLRDTGVHLMNPLHHQVMHEANGWAVLVGVPYAWASVHQFGATIRAKNAPYLVFKIGDRWTRKKQVTVPARPFLGITDEDRETISEIVYDEIKAS